MSNIKQICDMQSETGIIATLLEHPNYLCYSESLEPRHFFDVSNGCLYWAIKELYNSGIENIDVYNLTTVINKNKAIEKQISKTLTKDGLNEFIMLSKNVARNTVEEYKVIVANTINISYRREIYKNLQSCEQICLTGDITSKDLQKKIYSSLDKVDNNFLMYEDVPKYCETVRDLWETTKKRQLLNGENGIISKFNSVSNYFSFEKSELIIVAAHRKEGKSMFCLNEAVDKIKRDFNVVYFDTEMSDRLFNERMLCHLTGIPMRDIKKGTYSYDDGKKLEKAVDWLENKKNFTHIYMPNANPEEIYMKTKKIHKDSPVDLFVYDYFKSSSSIDASGAYFELGNSVNFIKNEICGELDIAGLGAAQLNRGGQIGDSFKIEQYASVIANLKRKTAEEIVTDGKECGNYKFFIKLNRLGDQMDDIATDYIDLNFQGDRCSFDEVKPHQIKTPY